MKSQSIGVAIFVIAALVAGAMHAQERLTLATPVSPPSVTDYQIAVVTLNRAQWIVSVALAPNTGGDRLLCTWSTTGGLQGLRCENGFVNAAAPTGQTLLIALNRANLSVTSLDRRIYNQLVTDGALAGSVTGAPQ